MVTTSPTRALDERLKAAREARERHTAELRARVLEIVRAELPPGARAWLIGSLAWGGFGERSDVDLVVSGIGADRLLTIEREVGRAAAAEVELLDLDILPATFRERVLAEGIAIHGG